MTAKLRTANIQGFKILQRRSLPTHRWTGYHTSTALTTSLKLLQKSLLHCAAGGQSRQRASDHGHTAVDVNRLTVDVTRFIRT